MSTRELGQAIDIDNPELLEQAEVGRVALPFEVILRLAGVLGRHDPATFAMKLARSYNPGLWKALEDLGVGKLVVQAGRTRTANIYRANDAARKLSDADCGDAGACQNRLRHGGAVSRRVVAEAWRRAAAAGKASRRA
jgi:hypothetical protein